MEVTFSDFNNFLHTCVGIGESKKSKISSFFDLRWLRYDPPKILASRPTYKNDKCSNFLDFKDINKLSRLASRKYLFEVKNLTSVFDLKKIKYFFIFKKIFFSWSVSFLTDKGKLSEIVFFWFRSYDFFSLW